jgi:hypothetical protein
MAKSVLLMLATQIETVNDRVLALERRLMRWHGGNTNSRRLATIPGNLAYANRILRFKYLPCVKRRQVLTSFGPSWHYRRPHWRHCGTAVLECGR